jgi:nitrogen-specific signal transduction histidine kinase
MDERDTLGFEIRCTANAIMMSAAAASSCFGTNECLEFLDCVQDEADRMEKLLERLGKLDEAKPMMQMSDALSGVLAA